jgi:predicted TPR repeat methyltransferase
MSGLTFRSSGDLTADRRYAYAVDLLQTGEPIAAGDLIEQALELVPEWPVGWFTLARAREASGDMTTATTAFERAAALDPQDELGARLHLARLGATATPSQPPTAYVRGLFDDYADRFDHALVGGLAYRAPQLIRAALAAASGVDRFQRCLDLGCGTGLMAEQLRSSVKDLIGVDLSARMIDVARAKGLYDRLVVGELIGSMQAETDATYDLITAADVFCYLGELDAAIAHCARLLRPGGYLAFSVERLPSSWDGAPFRVADSLRYRHDEGYVARLLVAAGLTIDRIDPETLRNDRGIPIEGLIMIASKRQT